MKRRDLVLRPTTDPLPARMATARELLERAVEPRWRVDMPMLIGPQHLAAICPVRTCSREVTTEGLCNGHALRWIRHGRPDRSVFTTGTTSALSDGHILPSCEVTGCQYGQARPSKLCRQHQRDWADAGFPPRSVWAATVVVDTPDGPTLLCRLPQCTLRCAAGETYCHTHAIKWRNRGEQPHEQFEAEIMNYGDPRWDFRRLPDQLKLEVQFALQRSSQLGYSKSAHSPSLAVRVLLRSGAMSLLEHTHAEWNDIFLDHVRPPKQSTNSRAFLGFAVQQIADLIEGSGWDNEYPRDVWQLHRLGYLSGTTTRQLDFTNIGQPWLVEAAKKWLHWRLTVEQKAIATVTSDTIAVRRLSTFLTATGQAQYSIRQLTRPVLEQHIAWLHGLQLNSATVRDSISAVAVFLRTLQDHEDWASDLPRNAVIYPSDYPRIDPLRARGISIHVMTQVRAHLPSWPNPDGRFLTELMLATGLRISDSCELSYDPLVFDNDGNPYIRYWNQKMRREAYVPISPAFLELVRLQQSRTKNRYPTQTADYLATASPRSLPHRGLRLTPQGFVNPHGDLGFNPGTYQQHLREFTARAAITDDAGRPVTLTAHQWRHTFATSLVNRGVRLEVVKQLLDHATLEMSAHYARLLDATVRAEWDAGRGNDDEYRHLLPADVEWSNRARTALPNGQCGLPRQQSCDHSNKCLSGPVFITTSTDLPAHEEQRRRTLTLITLFDSAGQSRLAEQNRVVLEQLDARITQIKEGLAGVTNGVHDAG